MRFGNPAAGDADVWRALEVAQARLRGGDAGRSRRSDRPGRHQRVGRAAPTARHRPGPRAQPGIYLFDDSFSALDLATDARLRAALAPVTTEAVTVVVAQRVSTIVRADQILVLEEGRSVGLGTHHELLDSCPTYAEIVESQFVAEEVA